MPCGIEVICLKTRETVGKSPSNVNSAIYFIHNRLCTSVRGQVPVIARREMRITHNKNVLKEIGAYLYPFLTTAKGV